MKDIRNTRSRDIFVAIPSDRASSLSVFGELMDNIGMSSVVILSEQRFSHDHVLSAEFQRSMFSWPQ